MQNPIQNSILRLKKLKKRQFILPYIIAIFFFYTIIRWVNLDDMNNLRFSQIDRIVLNFPEKTQDKGFELTLEEMQLCFDILTKRKGVVLEHPKFITRCKIEIFTLTNDHFSLVLEDHKDQPSSFYI